MVEKDTVLTKDDIRCLKKCLQEKKEGKLVPHEVLKKELGLELKPDYIKKAKKIMGEKPIKIGTLEELRKRYKF